MREPREWVWVFVPDGRQSLPSACFAGREEAVAWCVEVEASGVLTRYPVGLCVRDWAIESGLWKPSSPHQAAPSHAATFSSASLEHYHFRRGGGPDVRYLLGGEGEAELGVDGGSEGGAGD